MKVEHQQQHLIPREEIVLPVIRSSEGQGKRFYPGDALDIRTCDEDGKTLVAFHHRRHGVVWGRLDIGYTLDDAGTWSAEIGPSDSVRLLPFTILACGCVRNRGGWKVRLCPSCDKRETREAMLTKCDHGRSLAVPCQACVNQGDRKAEEDRRLIRDSQVQGRRR